MKILLIAGLPDYLPDESFDKVIGADRGALWALEQGLALDLAVGDFDSVLPAEFEKIRQQGGQVIRLPAEKDQTDLEAALLEAVKEPDAEAEITIIGALGGRLDHALTAIYLPTTAPFRSAAERICLLDAQNRISYLIKAGKHHLKRLPDYRYIGFQKLGAENFAIENAKYPLSAEENFADIYASNEFIGDSLSVSFTSGMVLAIYSKDKEKK